MSLDLQQVFEVALAAGRAASEVLLKYYGDAQIQHKGGKTQDLVTQADIEAEQAITAVINAEFPDHGILGEEGGESGNGAEHLWVVDPLDGTTNYAHGIPQFSTALGYTYQGIRQVGVVLDPIRDETFHAILGRGAYLNGQKIQVSECKVLSDAVVATGFYYDRGELMQRTLASISALFDKNIRGIRRFGGAALDQCWVANGRFDAFFEYQLAPWDYMAAALIVEEAGGRTTDRSGKKLDLASGSMIACSDGVYEQIRDVVQWTE